MKRILFVFTLISLISNAQEEATGIENITTPDQARVYAAENMWTEVVVLPKDECKWLLNVDRVEDPKDPSVGDMATIRNTDYKLIADTTIKLINISVIDFDLESMSEEVADSVIQSYIADLNRHGRFDIIVKNRLGADERHRYNNLVEPTSVIAEYFGTTFVSRKSGEVFVWRHPEKPYKFLIQMMQDPREIDGFIVLKARADQ